MRTAPAFQLRPRRCGGWAVCTACLFMAAGAVSLAWAGHTGGWTPALGLAGLLTLGCAWWLYLGAAPAPAFLRWDGQSWHWGASPSAAAQNDEPLCGRAAVCLDTGAFMLLHLKPLQPSAPAVWLPLSRRNMAAEWHLLRCALHASPGPVPLADARP